MLSQSVWDQMLESEKEKVKELEAKYADKMRANGVSFYSSLSIFVCIWTSVFICKLIFQCQLLDCFVFIQRFSISRLFLLTVQESCGVTL